MVSKNQAHPFRRGTLFLSVALGLLLPAAATANYAPNPADPGPYEVTYAAFWHEYVPAARPTSYTGNPKRSIPLRVWYPRGTGTFPRGVRTSYNTFDIRTAPECILQSDYTSMQASLAGSACDANNDGVLDTPLCNATFNYLHTTGVESNVCAVMGIEACTCFIPCGTGDRECIAGQQCKLATCRQQYEADGGPVRCTSDGQCPGGRICINDPADIYDGQCSEQPSIRLDTNTLGPVMSAGRDPIPELLWGTPVNSSAVTAINGKLPIAVYSHGMAGVPEIGFPLAELFASHGWIVVSVGHVGNTAYDQRGSVGRLPWAEVMLYRPQDLRAAVEFLGSVTGDARVKAGDLGSPSPATILENRGDTNRVFLMGQSFGGRTVLSAMGANLDVVDIIGAGPTDPLTNCIEQEATSTKILNQTLRGNDCSIFFELIANFRNTAPDGPLRMGSQFGVKAIGIQAPGVIGLEPNSYGNISVPVLLQSSMLDGAGDFETITGVRVWDYLDHPNRGAVLSQDVWMAFMRGGHQSFTGTCVGFNDDARSGPLASVGLGDGCNPVPGSGLDRPEKRYSDPRRLVPISDGYMHAFAAQHVLCNDANWSGSCDFTGFLRGAQALVPTALLGPPSFGPRGNIQVKQR